MLPAAVGAAVAIIAVASVVAFSACGQPDRDQGTVDRSQVKIDTAQAQAVATKTLPGTVEGTQLRTEGGIAAYTVTIKQPNGSLATVDVNASSGQVMRQENGVPDGDDGDGG